MDRDHILTEIARTGRENDGKPLGWRRFENETGIKKWQWQQYWARFADAQRDAGFQPNEKNISYDKTSIALRLAKLSQSLGRLPAVSDLRVAAAREAGFPDVRTIQRSLGNRDGMTQALLAFCADKDEYRDVVQWLQLEFSRPASALSITPRNGDAGSNDGFVYLIKSGRFHKLGRTNSVGRREREISLQLPEQTMVVHKIKTDDPVGIEKYWHSRFASQRKNGEWFDLTAQDVAAFRRRKFM